MIEKQKHPKTAVHLINGLGLGGAENMLYNFLKYGKSQKEVKNVVISLGAGSHFEKPIQDLGVPVYNLKLNGLSSRDLQTFQTLLKANYICSWSYHTNLLGVGFKLLRKRRLVWIINHEDTARNSNKLSTWLIIRACALLSRVTDAVAYNGSAAMKSHQKIGFSSKEQAVVPNGCDTDIFSPIHKSENFLQTELGIDLTGKKTVLSAGRWHPIKDHENFVKAFAKAKNSISTPLVAIMCGPGVSPDNQDAIDLLTREGLILNEDIFLLGPRNDLGMLMANVDLYVMHSKAEAFPNVLIQAMSSGIKVVSTDVGVVRDLTNGALKPTQPQNSDELAHEIENVLAEEEIQVDSDGNSLRQIIVDNYSISNVIKCYENIIIGTSQG